MWIERYERLKANDEHEDQRELDQRVVGQDLDDSTCTEVLVVSNHAEGCFRFGIGWGIEGFVDDRPKGQDPGLRQLGLVPVLALHHSLFRWHVNGQLGQPGLHGQRPGDHHGRPSRRDVADAADHPTGCLRQLRLHSLALPRCS